MGPRGRLPPLPPPPPRPPMPTHDPLAWLFVACVILFVGIVVYVAVRYANRPLPGVPTVAAAVSGQDPLALAALRYANGEIGREEYLRLTDDLTGSTGHSPPG